LIIVYKDDQFPQYYIDQRSIHCNNKLPRIKQSLFTPPFRSLNKQSLRLRRKSPRYSSPLSSLKIWRSGSDSKSLFTASQHLRVKNPRHLRSLNEKLMHAYLIVGSDQEKSLKEAQNLAKKLKSELYEFQIVKIDDVRVLQRFVKLKLTKPTSIFIKDIEKATTEGLNAFLKNLEEPQKNANYILTTSSSYKVLPTIVSRCQIIRIRNTKYEIRNTKIIYSFLKMSQGEKFKFLEKIRKRDDAASFIQDFMHICHDQLLNASEKKKFANLLEQAQKTYNAIAANGNVTLQLTNFAINI
jgi:hypothetical protein